MSDSEVLARAPLEQPTEVPSGPDPSDRPRRPRGAGGVRALRIHAARLDHGGGRAAPEAASDSAPRSGTVWFDYTDLVHYFDANRLPTGIQRVQIGIFRATLGRGETSTAGRVAACSFDPLRRCWVPLPEPLLASVCRAACQASGSTSAGPGSDADAWQALTQALRQAIAGGVAAPFGPGDVLVNVGTSWWIQDYLRYVQHLQRERGVLYAPFIHDCIPLRVPETCSANLVDEFREWFPEAMRVADIVLANSEHTARDIADFAPAASRDTGAVVQPHVVRLDARFDDGPQPGRSAAARLDALTHARLGIRGPFALFVATVESRKNHVFVFECWQGLIEQHGDAIPDLVCVGKQGWLVEYTLNWLRVHPELAGRVRLVGTVSDLDVASLYRTAEFTVYSSLYEGWGLPVTESLCHGRVPLVPNHSSLPEAGGPFAVYYEPASHAGFRAGVESLLDAPRRADMEARIRARYRPRGWSDVMEQIVTTVRLVEPRARVGSGAVTLEAGKLYGFGRRPTGAPRIEGVEPGHALKHGLGWWVAEEWGCWSRLSQAHLLFRVPSRPGTDLLYLFVRGGPETQHLEVHAGARTMPPVPLPAGQRRFIRLTLDPSARGKEVLVTLATPTYGLATHTGGGDPREVGFGLEALAVTSADDHRARNDITEFMLTPR